MQLDRSPLQKAREYVEADDSVGAVELLDILRETRKAKHPDRFLDAAAKAVAEEEFKKIGILITALDTFVQAEEAQRKPRELAIFKPMYAVAEAQRNIDALGEENSRLKDESKHLEERIADLEEQLGAKAKAEFDAEHEELRSLYRPKGKDLVPVGILLALSAIVPLFAKIEEVSSWLSRYAPFSKSYISLSVFFAFVAVLLLALKKLVESQFIAYRATTVLSPAFAVSFLKSLEAAQPPSEKPAKLEYFTESEAYAFIAKSPSRFWRFLGKFGFRGVSDEANTRLTSLFIDMLLGKKLVSFSYASRLDRRFRI